LIYVFDASGIVIPEARSMGISPPHFAGDREVSVEMVVEIPGTGLYDNSTTNKKD